MCLHLIARNDTLTNFHCHFEISITQSIHVGNEITVNLEPEWGFDILTFWSCARQLPCLHTVPYTWLAMYSTHILTRQSMNAISCLVPITWYWWWEWPGNETGLSWGRVCTRGNEVKCGSNRLATALALTSARFNQSIDFFPDAKCEYLQ